MPECSVPVLGRYLLNQLETSILLGQGEIQGGKESEQTMDLL